MLWILFSLLILTLFLQVYLSLIIQKKGKSEDKSQEQMQNLVSKFESSLNSNFSLSRTELSGQLRDIRVELQGSVVTLFTEQRAVLGQYRQDQTNFQENQLRTLDRITQRIEAQFQRLEESTKNDQRLFREGLASSFRDFYLEQEKSLKLLNQIQRDQLILLENRFSEFIQNADLRLTTIQKVVDEKLEKTLGERLGQSFEIVGKQLVEVQKGLGEMQNIAADVGGLKKVLSNVKLRGGVGEVQLAMLLEQTLAPNQYESNVVTKQGSNELVEFAIKLPGRGEDERSSVYLPVDAKFPKEVFERLLAAYDQANMDEVESASRALDSALRKMAKDIRDKYLDPPHTTDFAILFLPYESIYAEVIRKNDLVDQLRNEFKITVAGPTTFMAILNSLQMGFRTLAIQKRSSEVWAVLASVKTEFEKFGGLLEKAHKNIQTGLGQIDDVMGTRTRAIRRQLKGIEIAPVPDLPNQESKEIDEGLNEDA